MFIGGHFYSRTAERLSLSLLLSRAGFFLLSRSIARSLVSRSRRRLLYIHSQIYFWQPSSGLLGSAIPVRRTPWSRRSPETRLPVYSTWACVGTKPVFHQLIETSSACKLGADMRAASILLSSAFLMCVAARANTIQFTLTSNGVTGAGTLLGVADPYNSSALDITSATGTFGAYTLSLVTPSGNTQTAEQYSVNSGDPYPYIYDNVLFLTGTAVDINGLLFDLSGGPNVLNVYSVSGKYLTSEGPTSTYNPVYSATFSFTSVPEPSTVILLGIGLGLIFAGRRLRLA